MDPSINGRIDELIQELGLNTNSFAEAIGLNQATLFNIVRGRMSKPSFEVISKIGNTYPNLNMNWLINGEGNVWLDKKTGEKTPAEWDKLAVTSEEYLRKSSDSRHQDAASVIHYFRSQNRNLREKIFVLYDQYKALIDKIKKDL